MGWWQRLRRPERGEPELDLAGVAREEKRMEIREAQGVAQCRKLSHERDELQRQGRAETDEHRRRVLARRYLDCLNRLHRSEADLARTSKELLALMRIRTLLDQARTPGNALLERFDEAEAMRLDGLLIDDRVSEEMYREKLDLLLGKSAAIPGEARVSSPTPPTAPPSEDEVLEQWREAGGA